jgi:hypothetical protein
VSCLNERHFPWSIPNLLFFVRQPKEFLFRGSYVLVGTKVEKTFNLHGALLPRTIGFITSTFRDHDEGITLRK